MTHSRLDGPEPEHGRVPNVGPGDRQQDWLVYRLLNMGAFCDRDGRPLAEGKVPLGQRRPGVQFDLRPCPYPGARARAQPERPMNVSAMRRVVTTLPDSFGAFLHLRAAHLSRVARPLSTFADLWRLGVLGAALPLFLACRRIDAIADGDLPPYIADAQKFTAGIGTLMLELAFRELVSGRTAVPPMTVEALMVEADRLLVGESEVCAAPPALIAEGLGAFIDGRVTFNTVMPPLEELLRDATAFLNFAAAFADLRTFRWLIRCLLWCAAHDVTAATKDSDAQDRQEGHAPAQQRRQPFPGSDRSPTLDDLCGAIAAASADARFRMLERIAEGLVTQEGGARARLLDAFRHAARLLADDSIGDIEAIRRRFPAMSRSVAARSAGAVGRYLALEAAAVPILVELEADLRSPLGQPPIDRPPPAGLLDLVLEADLQAILRSAVGAAP